MSKINKKIIIGIAIVAILFFAGIVSWLLFQKERLLVPEEIIEEEITIEELLKQVNPEEIRPMTETEREEIDDLLKQVDPKEIRLMTETERREVEGLLK